MKEYFTYPSSNGEDIISAVKWLPQEKPKAIVQVAHGMCEYMDRYNDFGEFLSSKGFLVLGNDHLGHGKSVKNKENLGFFGKKNGNKYVLEDLKMLMNITKSQYKDIPYVFLGHSMGSFLLRQFLHTYPEESLNCAIIVGSGENPKTIVKLGKWLSKIIGKSKGLKYRSKLLLKMSLGGFNKKFEPAKTPVDWLTRDEKICSAYAKDPLTTYIFTAKTYEDMFDGILTNYKKENLIKIDKDLPIFIISGHDDPVGNFGKAIPKIQDSLKKVGVKNVSYKLYENCRHEILNELNKEDIYIDIIDFIEKEALDVR